MNEDMVMIMIVEMINWRISWFGLQPQWQQWYQSGFPPILTLPHPVYFHSLGPPWLLHRFPLSPHHPLSFTVVRLFWQRWLWRHLLKNFCGCPRQTEKPKAAEKPNQPDEPAQQWGRQKGKSNTIHVQYYLKEKREEKERDATTESPRSGAVESCWNGK